MRGLGWERMGLDGVVWYAVMVWCGMGFWYGESLVQDKSHRFASMTGKGVG